MICGNHNIFGVDLTSHGTGHRQTRHVGNVAERFDAMMDQAIKFFDRPASEDVARIAQTGNGGAGMAELIAGLLICGLVCLLILCWPQLGE